MDYQVPGSMMDEDGDIKDDSKRKTRNLSEKKRRDQFNQLVTELSTLVCSNNRKMNKSSVLKSTLTFLKNHNELTVRSRAHDVQEDWKPSFLSNEEFTYLVLEALEGFVMVFSANGRIYYVSESISSLLGHNPVEIINKNIFDLIFEEDRPNLFNLLQNNAIAIEQNPNFCIENEVIKFNAHLRRGNLDFKEEVSYDLVHFYGHCRTNQEHVDANREVMDYQNAESSILFVCIGRVQTPQLICDVSLVDSFRNEFTSRHSLEWKFLYLDHRAPPIIGYLPFEVLGTSGYDYYHFDDLEKVVSCHEALMQKGEVTSCYYRFLTKGQQWIWLQSRFYITYHQWNAKPEFVVCTHRVVSYADVVKGTKEENLELDTDTEAEATQNDNLLETPSEDLLPVLSPSSISEAASDAFANSYQPIPQVASDVQMPSLSPSYTAVSVSDDFGNIFQLVSQNTLKVASPELPCPSSVVSDLSSHDSLMTPFPEERLSPEVKNTQIDSNIIFNASTSQNSINGASSDVCVESPTNILEVADDAFNDCTRLQVRPVSACSISVGSTAGAMATAATSSTTWPSARNVYASGAGDSDTGSLSGESRSSQRNSEREPPYTLDGHLELLESGGYAGGVLPLSTLPTHGAPDNAQMQWPWQHQIQRKHEELQQMIVRQQEELRQVKEQLLLARLGILQPLINMPIAHSTPEELQNQQRLAAAAGIAGYPPGTSQPTLVALLPMSPNPPHPSQPPHSPQPPHPSQPPQTSHPSDPHQQMPQ